MRRLGRWPEYLLLGYGGPASAPPAFSPLDVTGLVAWYDFSDISTLFQDSAMTTPVTADGDVIGAVLDKSANDYHGLQVVTAEKPTYKAAIQNGLSVARGDGGDDLIVTAGPELTSFTAFWASVRPSSAAAHGLFAGTGGVGTRLGGDAKLRYQTGAGDTTVSTAVWSTSWYYGTFVRSVTALLNYQNGVNVTSGSPTNATDMPALTFLMSRDANPLAGDMGEMIFYDTALADADREAVEAYLSAKWGI